MVVVTLDSGQITSWAWGIYDGCYVLVVQWINGRVISLINEYKWGCFFFPQEKAVSMLFTSGPVYEGGYPLS